MTMWSNFLPVVVVLSSLVSLGISVPVFGAAEAPPAPEFVLVPDGGIPIAVARGDPDASSEARDLAHINVVTRADSPVRCVCPGTTLPIRVDGRCKCIETHFKRDSDLVPELRVALPESPVTLSKSTVTAPKSSFTTSSSLVANQKSSITKQNVSKTTTLDTAIVKSSVSKPTGPTATAKTTPTTPKTAPTTAKTAPTTAKTISTTVKTASTTAKTAPATVKTASNTAKTASTTAKTASTTAKTTPTKTAVKDSLTIGSPPSKNLPPLRPPILVCFSGACFGSTDLSGITDNIFKRDLGPVIHDARHLSETNDELPCTPDSYLTCVGGHCYCRISKHSMPDESVAHECPNDHILVCNSAACSCSKPASSGSNAGARLMDPSTCQFGQRICYESLCYCPTHPGNSMKKRSAEALAAVKDIDWCSYGASLLCFHGKCSCYFGPFQKVLAAPGRVSSARRRDSIPAEDDPALVEFLNLWFHGARALTPTAVAAIKDVGSPSPRPFKSEARHDSRAVKILPAPIGASAITLDINGKPILFPLSR